MNESKVRSAIMAIMIILVAIAFVWGFAAGPDHAKRSESAGITDPVDIRAINNGYGTIFVSGKRIVNKVDTRDSTVVDWRREPGARVDQGFMMEEIDGIVYKTGQITDGKDKGKPLQLHLNIKRKNENASKTTELQPVILFVPGGGFIGCDIDNKYRGVHRYLVEQGFAIAVMEYHVIGQGTYTDAVKDVRDAIRWIGEYGHYYGLKGDDVFLVGNSGGGYVASLAACQYPENIKCVVNFYGLCDIANNKADYGEEAVSAHHTEYSTDSQFVYGVYSEKALGKDPASDAKADPRTYIDGDEPPFIHFQGDADLWVSPSQTLHLHEALLKHGIGSDRIILHGEGHGSRGFRTRKALDTAVAFMNRNR